MAKTIPLTPVRFTGKKHTVETKQHLSSVLRKLWKPGGRLRRNQSHVATRLWSDPAFRKRTPGKISQSLKRLGIRPGLSVGARKLKRVIGRGWRLEFPIRGSGINSGLRIDIAHPGMKLAIEVDGSSHRRPGQQKLDLRRDRILRKLGWNVFRVTEEGCRLL